MKINIEKLREDLINYFGTAMFYNPTAMMNLEKVKKASEEELIKIALDNKFDLERYQIRVK